MLKPVLFKVTDPNVHAALNKTFDWIDNQPSVTASDPPRAGGVTSAATASSLPSVADLAGKTALPVEVKVAPGSLAGQPIVQKGQETVKQEPVSASSSIATPTGIDGLRAAALSVPGISPAVAITLVRTPVSTLLLNGGAGFAFHATIGQHTLEDRSILGTVTRAQFAKLWDHPKKLDAAFEAGAALADGFKEQIPAGVAVAVPVLGVCKNAYDARMAVIEHDQMAMVSAVAGQPCQKKAICFCQVLSLTFFEANPDTVVGLPQRGYLSSISKPRISEATKCWKTHAYGTVTHSTGACRMSLRVTQSGR
jgi:hypothetical protein